MIDINDIIEIINQAVLDYLPPEDSENDEIRGVIRHLLNTMENGYVLVEWPDLMEEDWFEEEAIPSYTGSAYFVPIKRIVGQHQ